MKRRLIFILTIVLFLGVMIHGVYAQNISTYPEIPYFQGYYESYAAINSYGFTGNPYSNVYLLAGISPKPEPPRSFIEIGTSLMAPLFSVQGDPVPEPPPYPRLNSFGFPSYLSYGVSPVPEPPLPFIGISTSFISPLSLVQVRPIPEPPSYPYWLNNIFALSP